jgi:hypothetical protein
MIQRIQSLWLALAAITTALMVLLNIYDYNVHMGDVIIAHRVKVNDHYLSLVCVVLATLLPTIAIFFFQNRKRQVLMAGVTLVCLAAVIAISLWRVANVTAQTDITDGRYGAGALLPVVSIVFLLLAMAAIRKDDKLVKSMDRLR